MGGWSIEGKEKRKKRGDIIDRDKEKGQGLEGLEYDMHSIVGDLTLLARLGLAWLFVLGKRKKKKAQSISGKVRYT